jgi:hypothetical protein
MENVFSCPGNMNSVNAILAYGKILVNEGNLDTLRTWFEEYEVPKNFDWPTVFQTLYLHACSKGQVEIADWFRTEVFVRLDPIQQIALRQCFSYGSYRLRQVLVRETKPSA